MGPGGFVVGGFTAMAIFSDWELLRLYAAHKEDEYLIIEGQRAPLRA
jgi:hypothetical protein